MEGGIRTPFMIRWPGRIPAGQVSNEIVHNTDLLTTLARAVGVVDQLPFFEGKQVKSNRESFLYFAPAGQVRAVKWGDWKLHYVWQDEPGQPVERTMKLFNLPSDPKEETDGKEFWNTRTDGVPYEYTPGVDGVIRGFEEGMREVREGDRLVITMKPELAYGERGNRDIPPNATLIFDYEILAVEPLSIARLLRDAVEAGTIDAALTRARGLSNLGEYYVSAASI